MIRRVIILASLAVAGAGVYLITQVGTLNAECSSNASPLTGAGVKPDCMNSVSLYFIGFVLLIGALIILMLAFTSMKKHDRDDRRQSAARASDRIHERDANPSRDRG